jgi:hypothetical protein
VLGVPARIERDRAITRRSNQTFGRQQERRTDSSGNIRAYVHAFDTVAVNLYPSDWGIPLLRHPHLMLLHGSANSLVGGRVRPISGALAAM